MKKTTITIIIIALIIVAVGFYLVVKSYNNSGPQNSNQASGQNNAALASADGNQLIDNSVTDNSSVDLGNLLG